MCTIFRLRRSKFVMKMDFDMCRSRQALSDEYLIAAIGGDTIEADLSDQILVRKSIFNAIAIWFSFTTSGISLVTILGNLSAIIHKIHKLFFLFSDTISFLVIFWYCVRACVLLLIHKIGLSFYVIVLGDHFAIIHKFQKSFVYCFLLLLSVFWCWCGVASDRANAWRDLPNWHSSAQLQTQTISQNIVKLFCYFIIFMINRYKLVR